MAACLWGDAVLSVARETLLATPLRARSRRSRSYAPTRIGQRFKIRRRNMNFDVEMAACVIAVASHACAKVTCLDAAEHGGLHRVLA
jgi:hypothetical protein